MADESSKGGSCLTRLIGGAISIALTASLPTLLEHYVFRSTVAPNALPTVATPDPEIANPVATPAPEISPLDPTLDPAVPAPDPTLDPTIDPYVVDTMPVGDESLPAESAPTEPIPAESALAPVPENEMPIEPLPDPPPADPAAANPDYKPGTVPSIVQQFLDKLIHQEPASPREG